MTADVDGRSPRHDVLLAVVEQHADGDEPQRRPSMDMAVGSDPREDAAARLRAARRERGWSLEELSNRTCIKASRLAQIEQGRVHDCGAAVYARGHLRAIATVLRIDPQPLIEALVSEEPPVPLAGHRPDCTYRPPVVITFLALCLVVLVLGLVLA